MDTYSNTRWRENNNDLPSNPKGTNFMDFHDHNVALPVIDSKGKGWQRNSPLLSSPNGSWPSSPSHHSPDNNVITRKDDSFHTKGRGPWPGSVARDRGEPLINRPETQNNKLYISSRPPHLWNTYPSNKEVPFISSPDSPASAVYNHHHHHHAYHSPLPMHHDHTNNMINPRDPRSRPHPVITSSITDYNKKSPLLVNPKSDNTPSHADKRNDHYAKRIDNSNISTTTSQTLIYNERIDTPNRSIASSSLKDFDTKRNSVYEKSTFDSDLHRRHQKRIKLEHSYADLSNSGQLSEPYTKKDHSQNGGHLTINDNVMNSVISLPISMPIISDEKETSTSCQVSSSEKMANKDMDDEGESIDEMEWEEFIDTSEDETNETSFSLVGFSLDLDPYSSCPIEKLLVQLPISLVSLSKNKNATRLVEPKSLYIYACHKSSSPANTSICSNSSIKSDSDLSDTVRSTSETSSTSMKLRSSSRQLKSSPRQSSIDSGSSTSTPEQMLKKRNNKSSFKDFIPEILQTRSRAETATMVRRHLMVKELERNEQERKATAIAEKDEIIQIDDECNISLSQDDSSSTVTVSSGNYDEFTPEFIQYCKMRYCSRISGSGDSVLHKICRTGKFKVARYFILMEHINVDCQDNAGWTPLHEACNNCYPDIVKLLLENGANPNLSSHNGTRPIHDALEAGELSIVKLLVQNGADFMAEYGGKTPLELAKSHGHLDIANYLEELQRERVKKLSEKKLETTLLKPKSVKVQSLCKKPVVDDPYVYLPFQGYSEPMFEDELDAPLVYISAIVEESDKPLLPVYNIKMVTGNNPRKHNFYLMWDILDNLNITREEFFIVINIKTYTMTINAFINQLLNNPLTANAKIIKNLREKDTNESIELVPLCTTIRQLFHINISNIDD